MFSWCSSTRVVPQGCPRLPSSSTPGRRGDSSWYRCLIIGVAEFRISGSFYHRYQIVVGEKCIITRFTNSCFVLRNKQRQTSVPFAFLVWESCWPLIWRPSCIFGRMSGFFNNWISGAIINQWGFIFKSIIQSPFSIEQWSSRDFWRPIRTLETCQSIILVSLLSSDISWLAEAWPSWWAWGWMTGCTAPSPSTTPWGAWSHSQVDR